MTDTITVQVKRVRLSGNRTDYFVEIQCGERSTTPYVFRERFKAEYETDCFAWVFGLRSDKPDLSTYDEKSYPND
jgi:hypothetical protein